MPIHIRINGLERIDAKLGAIVKKFPNFMEKTTMKAVLYVHSNIPPYPPQKAGATYERTGTLGRTVTSLQGSDPAALSRVESFGKSVKGIVGTRLYYAPYVIGDSPADNWWSLREVILKMRKGIRDVFVQGLREFLKREF